MTKIFLFIDSEDKIFIYWLTWEQLQNVPSVRSQWCCASVMGKQLWPHGGWCPQSIPKVHTWKQIFSPLAAHLFSFQGKTSFQFSNHKMFISPWKSLSILRVFLHILLLYSHKYILILSWIQSLYFLTWMLENTPR